MAAYGGHFDGFPPSSSGSSIFELRSNGSMAPIMLAHEGISIHLASNGSMAPLMLAHEGISTLELASDGSMAPLMPAHEGNSIFELRSNGSMAPLMPAHEGNSTFAFHYQGWCSKMDSTVTITNHYHKRGWRTESSAYVEWESTDREAPYPGGGTVDPAVGIVMYQWTTYSNGQPPS